MANRQYIGARYVPKFYEGTNGNNWDRGVTYDPLTVVTYLRDSYTSKKPVPNTIGDPAHNSEYWAHTGAYNAQVEAYREEVMEIADYVAEQAGKSQAYKCESFQPYAQVLPSDATYTSENNISAQGFCVAKDGDLKPLMLFQCFTDTSVNNNGGIFIYNVLSGHTLAARKGLSIGHANDATYNSHNGHFYVACAGGDNGVKKIVEFTQTGTEFMTHVLPTEWHSPYGIVFDDSDNTFWVLVGDNYVAHYNEALTEVIDEFEFNPPNYTAQSIALMYDRIVILYGKYFATGRGWMNIGLIYNKDGSHFGVMTFPCNSELESIDVANDAIYGNLNANNGSAIALFSMDRGNTIFDSFNFTKEDSFIGLNSQSNEYYVDTTANNILVENTADKPFRKFYHASAYAQDNLNRYMRFYIKGAVPHNINIKGHGGVMRITGQNGATVKGIHIENVSRAIVEDITVNYRNDFYNSFIDLIQSTYCVVSNVTFDHASGDTNNSYDISVREGSKCYMANTDCRAGGMYVAITGEIIAAENSRTGKVSGYGNAPVVQTDPMASDTELADFSKVEQFGTELLDDAVAYSLKNIMRTGQYRFEAGTTINGLPNFIKNFIINNEVNGVIDVQTLQARESGNYVNARQDIITNTGGWQVRNILEKSDTLHRGVFTILGRFPLVDNVTIDTTKVTGDIVPYAEATHVHTDGALTAATDIAANTLLFSISGFTDDDITRYVNAVANDGSSVALKFTNYGCYSVSAIANGTSTKTR